MSGSKMIMMTVSATRFGNDDTQKDKVARKSFLEDIVARKSLFPNKRNICHISPLPYPTWDPHKISWASVIVTTPECTCPQTDTTNKLFIAQFNARAWHLDCFTYFSSSSWLFLFVFSPLNSLLVCFFSLPLLHSLLISLLCFCHFYFTSLHL